MGVCRNLCKVESEREGIVGWSKVQRDSENIKDIYFSWVVVDIYCVDGLVEEEGLPQVLGLGSSITTPLVRHPPQFCCPAKGVFNQIRIANSNSFSGTGPLDV